MKLLVAFSFVVVLTALCATVFADTPAAIGSPATAPVANPVPAQVPAGKAVQGGGWYYIPSGWYMLVPAGSGATASAVPAATGKFPAPVAMPAGLPAAPATQPQIVIQQYLVTEPRRPVRLPRPAGRRIWKGSSASDRRAVRALGSIKKDIRPQARSPAAGCFFGMVQFFNL